MAQNSVFEKTGARFCCVQKRCAVQYILEVNIGKFDRELDEVIYLKEYVRAFTIDRTAGAQYLWFDAVLEVCDMTRWSVYVKLKFILPICIVFFFRLIPGRKIAEKLFVYFVAKFAWQVEESELGLWRWGEWLNAVSGSLRSHAEYLAWLMKQNGCQDRLKWSLRLLKDFVASRRRQSRSSDQTNSHKSTNDT